MGMEKCTSNVCRLCDTSGENLRSIFQKNSQGIQILNVIRECLPIVIYRTDPLSKHICDSCDTTLNLIHEFKENALKVANKYKEELLQSSDSKVKSYLELLEGRRKDDDWKSIKDESTLTDTIFPKELLKNGTKPVNGVNSITDSEDDVPIRNRLAKRKLRADCCEEPFSKRQKLVGPKSKMKPNPRIKITRTITYNPHSLMKCVIHTINKQNVPDFSEQPFERIITDIEEIINNCNYCMLVFDTEEELAKHELAHHIRLQLEKVDVLELWDNIENNASVRNKWLKLNVLGEEVSTEDDDELLELEDEDEEFEDDEGEYDLLMPLEHQQQSSTVNTSRNSSIVFVNEQPTINGVLLKDIPREKRNDFYQSVRLNGIRRKFCNLCRYTFKDNWAIELHYMSKTCYYTCNYCGVKFAKNRTGFLRHVQEHLRAGDKKCEDVFVNKSKNGLTPKRVSAGLLKPYIPIPRMQVVNNKIKPIKMKSLLEKKKVNPSTLQIKTEVVDDFVKKEPQVKPEPIPVIRPMTSIELAKTHSQAYFCKKCYQVFPKLDEFNIHNANCAGMVDDPEMKVIRPYVRKENRDKNWSPYAKKRPPSPEYKPKPQPEPLEERYSATGRPVRHCVKEVVSYSDGDDFNRASPSTYPGRFECSFCSSVFPTVHSRNSHMRIHKSGFKHAVGKGPAPIAPHSFNIKKVIKPDPDMITPKIKQENTFEPIVEIHEGHSSKVPSSIGSVSITPIRRNNNSAAAVSPAIMQLVQNNPNITLKATNSPRSETPPPPIAPEGSTDGRTYKCSSCSKSFGNKSNLYFHKKNHCGGSKYPCPFCKKRFGTEASYSSHIFYSHPV